MVVALPWTDRTGRVSVLKLVVFAALFVPGLLAAIGLARASLDPAPLVGPFAARPVTTALHETGDWAVRFLLLTLCITPLRRLSGWGKVLQVRRMLGLSVFFYALAHLLLYVAQEHGNLLKVASEIVLRVYLTIGFVALLALAVLAATSTDGAIRRLGAARWNRLHLLVHPVAVLALVHFFLQSKVDVSEPVLMSGLYLWLAGFRLLDRTPLKGAADGRRGRGVALLTLLGLALAAGLATAGVEAGWYGLASGVDPLRVLAANIDVSVLPPRPAVLVTLLGLAVALVQAATSGRRPPLRARAAAA